MGPCEEKGFVLGIKATLELFEEKNPVQARKLAGEARSIGEAVKSVDVIMMTGAVEGLARVSEGEVKEGMRLLDEAVATGISGESENLYLVGEVCCCLIAACERVRDYDRAAQWCEHVKAYCQRWRIGSLFSVCRTQYSSVLLLRGEWREAEEELTLAMEELGERRPALVGAAIVRLAELRRRQGRLAEAKTLFQDVDTHLLSLLGQGAIALDEGDATTSLDYAQRFLRRLPPSDKVERIPGLELLIRAYATVGEVEKAQRALTEIRSIVDRVSTEPLLAAARNAEGAVAFAQAHFEEALTCYEDALDHYTKAGLPYESIAARIALAQVLKRLERIPRAEIEAQIASARAAEIGATFLVKCAGELFPASTVPLHSVPLQAHEEGSLSRREAEVLRLIAEGKDNSEIADQLFLSIRTVERHISNTYQKLGISGKVARTAAAAYALKNLLR
jgi:ATP/maltotriose-dependent transcriptional regulator MalT